MHLWSRLSKLSKFVVQTVQLCRVCAVLVLCFVLCVARYFPAGLRATRCIRLLDRDRLVDNIRLLNKSPEEYLFKTPGREQRQTTKQARISEQKQTTRQHPTTKQARTTRQEQITRQKQINKTTSDY